MSDSTSQSAPCVSAVAVVKSDATTFNPPSRALFVGGAGDLTVTMADGVDCVFPGVPAGILLPIRVTKVKAATTATNIVRLS